LQHATGDQVAARSLQTHPEERDDAASPRFGHDFSRVPVHAPAARSIQRKLEVNQPGDACEQEADRISEQVMRMPEPLAASMPPASGRTAGLQRKCACGGTCDDCKKKSDDEEHARVQMKAAMPVNGGVVEAPPIVHDVLRSPGQPLDVSTRKFMEPRFGQDFSAVRIHVDGAAGRSAAEIGAQAYASGRHIVFAPGRFTPETEQGGKLLAHELTHTLQQSAAGSQAIYRKSNSKPSATAERPKIYKIEAFEESTDEAIAYVSADGAALEQEVIQITRNDLKAGNYTATRDADSAYGYQVDGGKGTFLWCNPLVSDENPDQITWCSGPSVKPSPGEHRHAKYGRSGKVEIIILPRHVQDFLTTREDSPAPSERKDPAAPPRSNDAQTLELFRTAHILIRSGVTQDQLVLEKHRMMDAADIGDDLPKTDMESWALEFAARQQKGSEEAVGQRKILMEALTRLEKVPPQYANILVNYFSDESQANLETSVNEMLNTNKWTNIWGESGFENRRDLFATLKRFTDAFEFELNALAGGVLNATEAARLEVLDQFVGNRKKILSPQFIREELAKANEDPEVIALVQRIHDEEKNAPSAARRASDYVSTSSLVSPMAGAAEKLGVLTQTQHYDRTMELLKEGLAKKVSEKSRLKVSGLKGLDILSFLSADGSRAQTAIDLALEDGRRTIRRARDKLTDDRKFVFAADKIIAGKKAELKIRKDGLVDRVIDSFVAARLSEKSTWESIWAIVDFVVSILPPTPVTVFLRTVAGLIDAAKATDDAATKDLLHDAELRYHGASAGELAQTYLFTAAGAIFDMSSIGVAGEAASLRTGLGEADRAAETSLAIDREAGTVLESRETRETIYEASKDLENAELTAVEAEAQLEHIAENPDMIHGSPPNRTAKVGDHTWQEKPGGVWCRHSNGEFCQVVKGELKDALAEGRLLQEDVHGIPAGPMSKDERLKLLKERMKALERETNRADRLRDAAPHARFDELRERYAPELRDNPELEEQLDFAQRLAEIDPGYDLNEIKEVEKDLNKLRKSRTGGYKDRSRKPQYLEELEARNTAAYEAAIRRLREELATDVQSEIARRGAKGIKVKVVATEATEVGAGQNRAAAREGVAIAPDHEYEITVPNDLRQEWGLPKKSVLSQGDVIFKPDDVRFSGSKYMFYDHKEVEGLWENSFYHGGLGKEKLEATLEAHLEIAKAMPNCAGWTYTTNNEAMIKDLTGKIDEMGATKWLKVVKK
jgi:hypothetical protein